MRAENSPCRHRRSPAKVIAIVVPGMASLHGFSSGAGQQEEDEDDAAALVAAHKILRLHKNKLTATLDRPRSAVTRVCLAARNAAERASPKDRKEHAPPPPAPRPRCSRPLTGPSSPRPDSRRNPGSRAPLHEPGWQRKAGHPTMFFSYVCVPSGASVTTGPSETFPGPGVVGRWSGAKGFPGPRTEEKNPRRRVSGEEADSPDLAGEGAPGAVAGVAATLAGQTDAAAKASAPGGAAGVAAPAGQTDAGALCRTPL